MASSTSSPLTTTTTFTTLLAGTRLAIGTAALLLPSATLSLFGMALPSRSPGIVMTRMFGVRDAVLGALLWTADSPAAVRRALVAGAVVDAVDVLNVTYGVFGGNVKMLAGELVGGGAVVFLVAGLWALRGWGKGGLEGVLKG